MARVQRLSSLKYDGQIPGTSGLRKKTLVFKQELYLHQFIQSIFNVSTLNLVGSALLVSGDGRYFSREAIQIICEIAAANGVKKVIIGKAGLVSTPAASVLLRKSAGLEKLQAAILLTASHNPGGIDEDFGVKVNDVTGGPARESITSEIASQSAALDEILHIELPKIEIDSICHLSLLQNTFSVEIIDPVEDWLQLMSCLFDFDAIRSLFARQDFSMVFDALNGVGGIYAVRLFNGVFHLPLDCLYGCTPLEDFGGCHPDPNLLHAARLVKQMKVDFHAQAEIDLSLLPKLAAAVDGDADRNMILGPGIFVTPGDSVAIITEYAQKCIPYFKNKLYGVARSMPTSKALDHTAKKLGLPLYETPVGWKYFVNLMDAKKISICGEESFGTSSSHIREKDGLWALLAWLSILAYRNKDCSLPFVGVGQIVNELWEENGRNYYCRYDYEGVDSGKAELVMQQLRDLTKICTKESAVLQNYPALCQYLRGTSEFSFYEFSYTDPVDGSTASKQGIIFSLGDTGRIIWRVSGTSSFAATIRVYLEVYETSHDRLHLQPVTAVKHLADIAAECSRIREITGFEGPTVVT